MIAFKPGVRVRRLTPAVAHILNCIADTRDELGYPSTFTVTSINDSSHGDNSRHFTDEAVDGRTHNMPSTAKARTFTKVLRGKLGDRFYVVFEKVDRPQEHIHAQVRKGHAYP